MPPEPSASDLLRQHLHAESGFAEDAVPPERLRAAVAMWERRIQNAEASQFARRGGFPFGDGTAADQSVNAVLRKLGVA